MSEEIQVTLEYRGNKTLTVGINFICNFVIRGYSKLMEKINSVQTLYQEIQAIQSEIAKGESTIESSAKNLKIVEDNTKTIKDLTKQDFFQRRFELITIILEDNNVSKEEFGFMYEFDFWDRQVEPPEIINFITKCVYKDASKKKALVEL